MSRVGLVVNPVGSPERASELADRLRGDHDVRVEETTEDDPGAAMASSLVEDGCEIVVACGGDGTVRATASALVKTPVPLGVLPSGTGNLLALNLGLPTSVTDVVELVSDGRSEIIDVGFANEEAFLVIAGAGLDTTIMEQTDRSAKDRLGPLAYALTALEHLNDEPFDIELAVDTEPTRRLTVATVLVANMGRVFGPIDLFPDSKWSDGRVDALAVTADSLASWAAATLEALSDPADFVHRCVAKEITIGFEAPRAYQVDGEERSPTDSIQVRVEPSALRVRRPA